MPFSTPAFEQDRHSRVACETYAKCNIVIVGGEITIPGLPEEKPLESVIPISQIVRKTVREIGYVNDDDVFHADKIAIQNIITKQSPDIAQGVDARAVEGKETAEQGAGDQGLMFGYACDETPELMPCSDHVRASTRPRAHAHSQKRQGRLAAAGREIAGLSRLRRRKSPIGISCVVVSTQHTRDVKHSEIRSFVIEEVIKKVLPKQMLSEDTQFLVNPTGNFVIGGPQGDTGLTGRKIIVDSYGGMGRHGGGAFSGKDPSKVDRSAAYMGRWVAKNVVAAGLAKKCELQFAYAIGHPNPLSVHIDTFGTHTVDEEAIERAVLATFSFKPADIIKQLNLLRPIYSKTTNYGHFGKIDDPDITWESTDKAAELKTAAK